MYPSFVLRIAGKALYDVVRSLFVAFAFLTQDRCCGTVLIDLSLKTAELSH
jgi:hypothetical protein